MRGQKDFKDMIMDAIRKSAAAVVAVFFCLPCAALSPLTPSLTDSTRMEMESQLTAVGLPKVAHSSVEYAVTSALGFQPDDNTFHNRELYPQLPEVVDVTATAVSGECSEVVADVRMARANVHARLRGRYCLVGPAEWEARSQSVQPFPLDSGMGSVLKRPQLRLLSYSFSGSSISSNVLSSPAL
jgi:hypothetical protein